jgi:hypothetical protein
MAPIESRPDQSDCDAYPHLEAVTVSKLIELEGWGLAQPLHLFEFFKNLPYLVHLYATGDSQSHPNSDKIRGKRRWLKSIFTEFLRNGQPTFKIDKSTLKVES